MDISLYERLPGDIGDIRTSQCTNGYPHRDISQDQRPPAIGYLLDRLQGQEAAGAIGSRGDRLWGREQLIV